MVKGAMFLAGLALLGQHLGVRPVAAPVPEKVAVCEVARTGPKYAGHTVELTGTVVGMDPNLLLLTSPDCMLGVRLAFSPGVREHDDVRILFAAVKRGRTVQSGSGAGVTATFEGVYSYSDDRATVGLQVAGIDELNFPKR
jgi:hypothetical protein